MTTIFGWTIPPIVYTIFYGAMGRARPLLRPVRNYP
jgi:hypothetical protein